MFKENECVETRDASCSYDPAAGFVISQDWNGVIEVYLYGYGIVHLHEDVVRSQKWFIKEQEALRFIEAPHA